MTSGYSSSPPAAWRVATTDHLADGRVVIHAFDLFDPKPPVPRLKRLTIDEADDRTNHLLTMQMSNVHALHAARRSLHAKQFAEFLQPLARVNEKRLRLEILVRVTR